MPVDLGRYPDQGITGVDFANAIARWNLGNYPKINQQDVSWKGRVLKVQEQTAALCGLHALNAIHDPGAAIFPWYTEDMLKAALKHAQNKGFADFLGLDRSNDYSDPNTLMILARTRGDFLVRVDMQDRYGLQYVYGLYPLPEKGRWIISYPGHHVAVWRDDNDFILLDSRDLGGGSHSIEFESPTEYVEYVQKNFGETYSYLIYFTDQDLLDNKYREIETKDEVLWNTDRVNLSWADLLDARIKYSARQDLILTGHLGDAVVIETIQDYTSATFKPMNPNVFGSAEFELVGLSTLDVSNNHLLTRKNKLDQYLDALKLIKKGSQKREFQDIVKSLNGEGRLFLTPRQFSRVPLVSEDEARNNRLTWLTVLDILMTKWLKNKVDEVMNFIDPEAVIGGSTTKLLREWKPQLERKWRELIQKELYTWYNSDWEYIPLNRLFYDELLNTTEWERRGEGDAAKAIRLNKEVRIISEWAPATDLSKIKQITQIYDMKNASKYKLSEESIGFTPAALYEYLDILLILDSNSRWNPESVISSYDEYARSKPDSKIVPTPVDKQNPNYKVIEIGYLSLIYASVFSQAFYLPDVFLNEYTRGIDALRLVYYEYIRDNYIKPLVGNLKEVVKILNGNSHTKNNFSLILPIYTDNPFTLSQLKAKAESFRFLAGFESRKDHWYTILQRAFGLPEDQRKIFIQGGGEIPIPYEFWISPEDLNYGLSNIINKDKTEVDEIIKKIFHKSDPKFQVFALVKQKVEELANMNFAEYDQVWAAILEGYKKRRMPLGQGLDEASITRLLVMEEIEMIEREIRRYKPQYIPLIVKRTLNQGTLNSGEPVIGKVEVKVTKTDDIDNPTRKYYYRWRFSQPHGSKSVKKEWYDGPTHSRFSTTTLHPSIGSGILTCEAYVLYQIPGSQEFRFVQQLLCPGSLNLQVFHTCVRCGKPYDRSQNYYGACIFHPAPSPAQSFVLAQAATDNSARDWSYFMRILRDSWSFLPEPEARRWLTETLAKFGINLGSRDLGESFEEFSNYLTRLPFSKVLESLQAFPWRVAIEGKYGLIAPYTKSRPPPNTDERKILPRTIRQDLSSLPTMYLERIKNKWLQFLGTTTMLEKKRLGMYSGSAMDENSPDPCKMQLDRLGPSNLWIDDTTSTYFKGRAQRGPFDFDGNRWKCCNKRGLESEGCWIDYHTERNPYVRFIGDKEHNDAKGSWHIYTKQEFESLWEQIQSLASRGKIEAARDAITSYFALQCRCSGYNAGDTPYWPIDKRKTGKIDLYKPSQPLLVTNPALPKKGFAQWDLPIPVYDLISRMVNIQKSKGTVTPFLAPLLKLLQDYNKFVVAPPVKGGRLTGPVLTPLVTTRLGSGLVGDEEDDLFGGLLIPVMPILSIALIEPGRFVDALPILSILANDVPYTFS